MISKDQLRTLRDGDLYSVDGDKIGSIGEIYLDDRTNEPEWVTVNTGLFGTSQSFVPLAGATVTDNGLTVQYSKDKVKDAPRVDGDEHLDVEQERELYRYYEVSGDSAEVTERRSDDVAAGTAAAGTAAAGVADRDRVDADRDDVAAGTAAAGVADRDRVDADRDVADRVDTGDDTMVRHEERLNVGTERVDGGELRLRKYVDTEEQTVTVPVTTESAKVVSRPVDGNTVDNGEAFREEEIDVHLESERPVVSKETVAVEEVGIETERHTENVEVSDSVRKERVEVEGEDVDGTRR
ncbi:YsnF/AvaK domain-containing protein [Kytococcus schroeteri]|uniref:YsnF/AvaK domain-containing protein n=1 Tax=Kytococcus schroeteri TaxID=138300 RepID=UPI0035EA1F57